MEFSIDFHFPPYWRSKGRRRCSWWFVRATNPSLQLTLLCAACEVFTRTLRVCVLNQEEGESTDMVCNKLNGETHCLVGLSNCRLNEGLPQFKVGSHAKYVYYYCSLCLQIMLLGESFVIWHTQKHRGSHTGLEHWNYYFRLSLSLLPFTNTDHDKRQSPGWINEPTGQTETHRLRKLIQTESEDSKDRSSDTGKEQELNNGISHMRCLTSDEMCVCQWMGILRHGAWAQVKDSTRMC